MVLGICRATLGILLLVLDSSNFLEMFLLDSQPRVEVFTHVLLYSYDYSAVNAKHWSLANRDIQRGKSSVGEVKCRD